MGKKDNGYQVVYRGEALPRYVSGGQAFFQRPKECGGGYWLGRTSDGVFMFEIPRPVTPNQGRLNDQT
ncbi:ABC transporter ATP-binding protein [Cronobacter dublinensis]|uniref:ABC transporter ATP-binding protein n=1 Tax=Cronobacter dublinensis TaxID=413497 RepID=UPI0013758641|nr:ABC transporter ATP-binding protein [Cronobacter dublinensis]NCH73286.1 ABC transporter ATP-binding protein [Cronobacter dublinensis]